MPIAAEMSVLVVDDHPDMLKLATFALNRLGFSNVETAGNGEEAIAALNGSIFDLIISDYQMSPVNGLELLQQVRATPATADIPFVMMTGEGDNQTLLDARQSGVSQYLVKPFNARSLRNKLEILFPELG